MHWNRNPKSNTKTLIALPAAARRYGMMTVLEMKLKIEHKNDQFQAT
jgi:hypothetical protein